jgi:Carboxypeptidase regulatory-like domain
MLRAQLLSCGILLLLPTYVAAENVKLELAVAGRHSSDPQIQVRLLAEQEDEGPESGDQVIEAAAPGKLDLDLAPRRWTLTAKAEGHWSQPAYLDLTGGASSAWITLWPTGTLQGRLRSADRQGLPETIELLFRSVPTITAAPDAVPPDWLLCPVTEDAWSCELPAGILDVQVASAGFVKQYIWDVAIQAGASADLGTIEMRRGSSVRGWVLTEAGAPAQGARIELSPRAAASTPDPVANARLADLIAATTANHRGFFQLAGMKPGDYVLVAEKDSFAPARTTVRVLEDEATEVADPPLTLFAPSVLEVYVDPPAPPGAGLWQAELVQYDSDFHRIGVFAEGPIPADGSWRLERAPTGVFALTLSTSNGDRWVVQKLELGSASGPFFVTIPIVEVRGRVRLGSQPLTARLSFGGKHGSQNVYLATDEEGKFSGLLPRAGNWNVAVEVQELPIRREVQVEVEEGEELDLEFPDTVVRGVVVNESGDAVPQAIVRVRNIGQPELSADLFVSEAGRFESVGLPTGRTVLMAEDFQQTSELYELVLEEDREPPEVRLVLRRNAKLEGRVVSEQGGGVPGARVTAMSVDALSMGHPFLGTDAEGRFETRLPPRSRNLVMTVAAPGYAFRTFQVPFDDEPLVVSVGHAGGTLILELPESLDLERWDHRRPIVFHGGGIASILSLREWALFHGQSPGSDNRFVIPEVEPGRYAACLAPLEAFRPLLAGANPGLPCVAGDLSIGGELTLSLRGASPKAGT